MKKTSVVLQTLVIVALLTSCASQPKVSHHVSDVSRFHDLESVHFGSTITVLPSNKAVADSLEFKTYKQKVEYYLRSKGFIVLPADSGSPARLTALLNYGIDDGKVVTENYSVPIYGQTGVSSSSTLGYANIYGNYGTYSGTTYYTPSYGITGYSSQSASATVYTRVVHLDIFDTASTQSSPRKIYEAKAVSRGRCGSVNQVIDEMLAALFKDFAGQSGVSERVVQEQPYEKYGSCFQ